MRIPAITIVASICLHTTLRAQQFSAEKPIQLPDATAVEDIAVGDLDNDGDLDLVICTASYGAHVGIYFNDGTGAFGPQVKLADANEATELALLDLDNDGDLDVTWANYTGPAVAWCRNMGDGAFSAPLSLGIQSAASSFSWGDVDQDGDLDLFTAHYGNGPNLGYSLNDGNLAFGPRQAVISLYETFHCAAGDMDDDGDIDGVIAGEGVIWRNNENDGFVGVAPPNGGILDETTGVISKVIIHHGDQPGEVGVYVAETGSDQVRAFGHLGAGEFNAGSVVGPAPGVKDLFVADMNGDGQDDLLAACPEDNTIRAFYSMVAHNFLLSGISGASRVAAGDFDNDGMTDLVTTAFGGLAVFRQVSSNTFSAPQQLGPMVGSVADMIAADLNGDDLPDPIFILAGTNVLCWRPSLGNDDYGAAQVIVESLTAWGQVLAHDLDGDGDLDLVMGFPGEKLAWFRNNGSGGFTIPLTIASDFGPTDEFDIGDLDGDGDADIVAAGGTANVQRFLNAGNGDFDPPVQVDAVGGQELALSDMDGDGDRDIVLHRGANGIQVYSNDGAAFFTLSATVPTGAQTVDMRTGDMTGDGFTDIVALSAYGAQAYLYRSNGDGTFSPADTLDAPAGFAAEIALADMDRDGDLDLVAAVDADHLHIYPNDGSGDVGAPLMLGAFLGDASQCTVADMDKDGDIDLLGGSFSSQRASWFENFTGSPYGAEGHLYYDLDGNGAWNTTDVPFPFHAVTCMPSASAPYSGPDGHYRCTTDAGDYTISAPSIDPFWEVGSPPQQFAVSLNAAEPIADSLDFGYVAAYDTLVLEVASTASPLRCAQPYNRWIDIDNRGTLAADVMVELFLPSAETVLSVEPPPDEILGALYRWNSLSIPVLGHVRIHLLGEHGLGTGFNLYDSLSVTATAPGASAVYNEAHSRLTACSFDPNDKQVFPVGYGTAGAVDIATDRLTYTVRFQNTGTDTAFTVMLRDRLSPWLDHSSIHVIGSSHIITWLNVENDGEAVFLFNDILLPDSNVDEAASHGYVVFSIGVVPGAPSGTAIENDAGIYFDINAPVITNTVLTTLIDCDLYAAGIDFVDGLYLQATAGESYQWFVYGEPIAGATGREHFFAQNGSYTVEVTSAYGCVAMSDPYEVVSTVVNEDGGLRLAVFPNPMTDAVRVLLNSPLDARSLIEMVDVHGHVVLTARGNGSREVLITRGGVTAGLYTLRVVRGSGITGSARLVVE